jgi:hypothetical protein
MSIHTTPGLGDYLIESLHPRLIDFMGGKYISVSMPAGNFASVYRVDLITSDNVNYSVDLVQVAEFTGETAHSDAVRNASDLDYIMA